ncbi:MAG: hypothetical protein ACYSVY_24670 [Planctomycetota bacterium]
MSTSLAESWTRCRARIEAVPLRRRQLAGLAVCYLAFLSLLDAKLWRPDWHLHPGLNVNVAEARAWLAGRLELDDAAGPMQRPWDTAVYRDKVYSHFPPAFTLLSVLVLPWSPVGFPHLLLVALLVLPLPGLAYLLFLRRTGRPLTATLVTVCYLLGTSLLPVVTWAVRSGQMYHVNHALSQVGLLIFLLELFGRRRIWLGGFALALAFWSRQLTLAYALPLVWMAYANVPDRRRWRSRVALALAITVGMVSLPLTLNALKFGHPLDTGYRHVYAGREDKLSREAEHGIFSLHFVPRNLYYTNLGLPRFYDIGGHWHLRPNMEATGIWWTTPLLIYLLVFWRRIGRSGPGRTALLAVALIWVALLCYHSTGWEQRGYNRYSLDYVPMMLALVAPYCQRGRLRWVTPAAVAWSIAYFAWLT